MISLSWKLKIGIALNFWKKIIFIGGLKTHIIGTYYLKVDIYNLFIFKENIFINSLISIPFFIIFK